MLQLSCFSRFRQLASSLLPWAVGLLLIAGSSGTGSADDPKAADFHRDNLFTANTNGYEVYRIPGIVVTTKGTVLVYCEARKSARSDWGAIDIWLRRGSRGGQDWEPARKIATPPPAAVRNPAAVKQKLGKPGEITLNNPVAIVDRDTGAVHFLYCLEYGRCFYMRSDDDGRTFSKPVDITAAFETFRPAYDWKVLATGPGHGIQLKNGRLLVPVWLSTGTGGHAHRPSCVSVIYSDDHGKSWQRGDIAVSHPEPANPSESMLVQLADGRVMLNFRHEGKKHRRGVVLSADGATRWSAPSYPPQLPEPVCMASLARLTTAPPADKNRLLFSNPNNFTSRERKNVAVRLSYDEGKTWPVVRTIEAGPSGYSDLAVGPDGTIYCFYERGRHASGIQPHHLCLARFSLAWLTEGKDRLDTREK